MTERLFYTSRATEAVATVIRVVDEPFPAVELDRTIFVPKGGGQPSDTGEIGGILVTHVESDPEGNIVHAVSRTEGIHVGDTVNIRVEADRRWLHSRLHSAGHAVAAVVETLCPFASAKSGHHWPGGEARVEFSVDGTVDPTELLDRVGSELKRVLALDLPVHVTAGSPPPRTVKIGEYAAVACGGTHVSRLSEIGVVVVRGIKLRKGLLRVGYDIE